MAFRVQSQGVIYCLLLATVSCSNKPDTGIITGRMLDHAGHPAIHHAWVVVMGTTYGAFADSLGRFTIRDVPAGTYRVRGSSGAQERCLIGGVNVTARETTTVQLNLARRQIPSYADDPCAVNAIPSRETWEATAKHEVHARIESTLCLVPPVRVEQWAFSRDGGTQTMTLRDSCGSAMQVSWDGRMRRVPFPGQTPVVGEPTIDDPQLLYFGAPSRDPNARAIPIGSAEETAIVDVLRVWLLEQTPSGRYDSQIVDGITRLLQILSCQRADLRAS